MKRYKPKGLDVAKNHGDILTAINNHAYFYAEVDKPNQTHEEYITYDISCNEDFALHAKYHDWSRIFQFFVDHPIAMATFATKIVPVDFLDFDPQGKVRIRFSIMPQTIADILEPNTAKIIDRIKAIDAFIEAGYDVHVNFSPVVYYRQWLNDYRELFEMLDHYIDDVNKSQVLAEVIFLTHNKKKHEYNLENDIDGEGLMWVPTLQETKKSQYGGENIRYKIHVKVEMIDQWTKLHDELIPWNKIRYIF
jgi:spore photoproduct lyase